MFEIEKENIFVDSIISENENNGKSFEVKILIDATDDEIKNRFGTNLPDSSLVAYVTVGKYNKLLNCVVFELEAANGKTKSLSTILSNKERDILRKAAILEMSRYYYYK